MTLTLTLPPDQAALLQERAAHAGLPPEEYMLQLLAQTEPPPADPPASAEETGAEKAARFRRWADSHDRTKPVIPLEFLTREHIYEERG